MLTEDQRIAKEIGERVAQARREKGVRERRDITQREVAKEIGVSPTTVSDAEAGKQIPGERVIQKLAAHLGVTPAFLRYGVADTTKPAEVGGLEDVDVGAVPLTVRAKARATEKAAAKAERQASKSVPRGRRPGTRGQ